MKIPLIVNIISTLLFIGAGVGLYKQHQYIQALPDLDACAQKANVYRCQYTAEPIVSNILPPPDEAK